MNVRCTHCRKIYRVDPRLVPQQGVKVRCAKCTDVFQITRQTTGQEPRGIQPGAAGHQAPSQATESYRPTEMDATMDAATEQSVPDQPALEHLAPTVDRKEQEPPAGGKQLLPGTEPMDRAQRLARALVSDIVVYNPERQQSSSAAGTLKTEFRDEIRKSWQEYVQQVGMETARETPYFRNALNDILAGGKKVF